MKHFVQNTVGKYTNTPINFNMLVLIPLDKKNKQNNKQISSIVFKQYVTCCRLRLQPQVTLFLHTTNKKIIRNIERQQIRKYNVMIIYNSLVTST